MPPIRLTYPVPQVARILLVFFLFGLLRPGVSLAEENGARGERADLAWGLWLDFRRAYHEHALEPMADEQLFRSVFLAGARRWAIRRQELLAKIKRVSTAEDEGILLPLLSELSEAAKKPLFDVVEEALEAFCRSLDPYSSYERSWEAAEADAMPKGTGGGVGMVLEQDESGRLLCYPQNDSPAARAGVQYGDTLVTIDGAPAQGMRLHQAAARIGGLPGTRVELGVRRVGGREEILEVIREAKDVATVTSQESAVGPVVTIRNFTKGTAARLRDLLAGFKPGRRLTVDLRGNPGGDLAEAVLAASIFLPENTVVGRVETRGGTEDLVDGNGRLYEPARVIFKVDGRTTSGAELFVAALLAAPPCPVEVFGEKTFGKALVMHRVRLGSGGYLTLVSGRLSDANGHSWQDTGIRPSP